MGKAAVGFGGITESHLHALTPQHECWSGGFQPPPPKKETFSCPLKEPFLWSDQGTLGWKSRPGIK